jgi:hypothetical protein
MKADAFFTAVIEIENAKSERTLCRHKRNWDLCLLISSNSAAVTGIFGLVLSGAVFVGLIPHDGRLSIFGSLLLAVSFPLLVLAAHCLDRIDEVKHAIRRADLNRRLFKQ